jgi:hypothetical protein
LVHSPERGVDTRFAERVQLDLLKAGVTCVIERLSAAALVRAERSGDFDLLLDAVTLEGMPRGDSIDRVLALGSISSWFGKPEDWLDPAELAKISALEEPSRILTIASLEARMKQQLGLLPIAARTPPVFVRRALVGVRSSGSGLIQLEDTTLGGLAAERE